MRQGDKLQTTLFFKKALNELKASLSQLSLNIFWKHSARHAIKINCMKLWTFDPENLLNCLTRLAHHYTRLTCLRVYAPLPSSIGALRAFVLSCVVLLELKDKVCFVCVLQLAIHPLLSSLLVYLIKLFCVLFSFFYFKPLITILLIVILQQYNV